MYQFTRTEHTGADNRKFHGSLQNSELLVRNLLQEIILAPTIWGGS